MRINIHGFRTARHDAPQRYEVLCGISGALKGSRRALFINITRFGHVPYNPYNVRYTDQRILYALPELRTGHNTGPESPDALIQLLFVSYFSPK